MLSMTEIQQIITLFFNEEKSITEIKRLTGRDRKTIRMYINNEDWNISKKDKKEILYPKLEVRYGLRAEMIVTRNSSFEPL